MNLKAIALWACLLSASASYANTKYTVQKGENDVTIAKKFGVTLSKLHDLNPNIEWDRLQIGENLTVSRDKKRDSKSTKSVSATKRVGIHTVTKGESDYAIAKEFGMTSAQLRGLNPGVSFEPLRLGVKLNVYMKASASKTAKPTPTAQSSVPGGVKPVIFKTTHVRVSRSSVIVRASASTDAKKLTLVDAGTIAKVVGRDGAWYKLQFNWGGSGWVRCDMLEASNDVIQAKAATVAAKAPSKPAPKTAPKTIAAISGPATSTQQNLLSSAFDCIGIPYVYGGTSRGGFDCSGFVGYVFRKNGVNLPRTALEQSRVGSPVAKSSLVAGDMIFFNTRGSRVSHVGIYIGKNKFIHASSTGGHIRINDLAGYYADRYVGARRVLKNVGSDMISTISVPKLPVEEPAFDPEPLPEVPTQKGSLGTDVISG